MAKRIEWTEALILQAFDNFIKVNSRFPKTKEMENDTDLPSRTVLRNRLGLTRQEFIRKYYSEFLLSDSYNNLSRDYWLSDFKYQFIKLGLPKEDYYNLHRAEGSPHTQSLKRWFGDLQWGEFLNYCGFNPYNKQKKGYIVNITFSNKSSLENAKNICKEINNILENKTV